MLRHLEKILPPINYKFQRTARKNYICESCGNEIHKNELYYEYKPNPSYNSKDHKMKYDRWRKRCFDCEPFYHSELLLIKED